MLLRRAFTFFIALSLVLCLALVVVLIRSYAVLDRVELRTSQVFARLTSSRGITRIEVMKIDARSLSHLPWTFTKERPTKIGGFPPLLLFEYTQDWIGFDHSDISTSAVFAQGNVLVLSLWSATVLTGIAPICWFRRYLRRCKLTTGLCSRCGYDLRATPHRCPECGAIPRGD